MLVYFLWDKYVKAGQAGQTNQFVKYTAFSYPEDEFEYELPGDEDGEDALLLLLENVGTRLDEGEIVCEDPTVVDEFP